MTLLNEDIYYSHLLKLELNDELRQLTNRHYDDCVTMLRIHLMCEQMLVAWICAASSDPEVIAKKRRKPTFSEKLKTATKLGFPEPIRFAFSLINDQRNQFAHNIKMKSIEAGFIRQLLDTVSGFNGRAFNPEYILVTTSNETEHGVNNAATPNKLKLCIIYLSIQMKIGFSVSPSRKLSKGSGKVVITVEL